MRAVLRRSPTHCPNRTTLGIEGRDGAFTTYLALPIRNLVPVPEDLPDDVIVFIEPLAAVDGDLTAVVVDEMRLLGSRCGPFEPALRLLERGLVDVASLVEMIYPLNEAPAALAHAAEPEALKVFIDLRA